MEMTCQIKSVNGMGSGRAAFPQLSFEQRVRLFARRHLSLKTKRRIKALLALLPAHKPEQETAFSAAFIHTADTSVVRLQAGDQVRVRTYEEIEHTLNSSRQCKSCSFMGEMARYCGMEQRVLKPVRRFVDERDASVHKASGIVLLEGVMCQGTADYGACDRSCFYFWREEWLEKIVPDGEPDDNSRAKQQA